MRALALLIASASQLAAMAIAAEDFTSDATQQARDIDIAAIDAYLETAMVVAHIPGLALGIVQNDRIVHLRGFGTADPTGRPVTPQTPFVLGSVSKSFTALAVTQLIEAGRLELDTPVQRYLPWFRVADASASSQITVGHLLSHTSGLSRSASSIGDGKERTLEQRIRDLEVAELTHAVGSSYAYSNVNYATLGLLVQTVSGQSYGDYIQQHVFDRLDMRHSFVSQARAREDGLATGYRIWFGFPVAANISYGQDQLPGSALISSAEDMTHYLIAQLNSGYFGDRSVASPEAIQAMHTPGQGAFYGRGWRKTAVNGVPAIWHSGVVSNYQSFVAFSPEERWGVVVLMNVRSVLATTIRRQVARGVVSLLAGREPPPQRGLSFTTRYVLVDLAFLLVMLILIWASYSLWQDYKDPTRGPQDAKSIMQVRFFSFAGPVLIPLATIVLVPLMTGVRLRAMLTNEPGLTHVFLILSAVQIVYGVLRITLTFRKPGLEPASA
ncbi:MAG: beta-lactamase family protein [Gemmatimonadetes bacterium]|nr:beta-lactamase family protein [Gemmatimonadota bacterium]